MKAWYARFKKLDLELRGQEVVFDEPADVLRVINSDGDATQVTVYPDRDADGQPCSVYSNSTTGYTGYVYKTDKQDGYHLTDAEAENLYKALLPLREEVEKAEFLKKPETERIALIAKEKAPGNKDKFLPYVRAAIQYFRFENERAIERDQTAKSFSCAQQILEYEKEFRLLTGRNWEESDAITLDEVEALPTPEPKAAPEPRILLYECLECGHTYKDADKLEQGARLSEYTAMGCVRCA